MHKNIAVLAGDGIGPEIITEAIKVLQAVAKKYHHSFTYEHALMGAAAIDETGNHCQTKHLRFVSRVMRSCLVRLVIQNMTMTPMQKLPEQGLLALRKASTSFVMCVLSQYMTV